jgi:hypothetical protein
MWSLVLQITGLTASDLTAMKNKISPIVQSARDKNQQVNQATTVAEVIAIMGW